ncbi:hypothetical protein bcere0018_27130 [Bacillus cereus Rock1-15]|nr:hypothetical protein bcere0018_27130 [Bacillus cereus Rock1-15]
MKTTFIDARQDIPSFLISNINLSQNKNTVTTLFTLYLPYLK